MGPGPFDCSGLVIRSIADVLGGETRDWPAQYRHVREMWPTDAQEGQPFRRVPLAIGQLVVCHRWYNIEGVFTQTPGHIGIITKVGEDNVCCIQTSSLTGKVTEGWLRQPQTIIGGLEPDYKTLMAVPQSLPTSEQYPHAS
jgi:hypothetical protein